MAIGTSASAVQLDQSVDPMEYCHVQGWTDGLPVVPPTPDRVKSMLSTVDRQAQEVLGTFPPIGGEATVEKVAINAVMAGCLPEYFPVVITAIECLAERPDSLGVLLTGIHGDAPLLVINGPVVRKLGFNSAANTFGPGWRANSTVGRAVALSMRNIAVGPPGQFDVATQTHPGKLASCIAEFEEASPWSPLHIERGLDAQDSAVTVVGAQGPLLASDMVSPSANGVLTTLADSMSIMGSYNIYLGGEILVVMCPTHARLLANEGLSKDDTRNYLWEHARRPLGTLKRGGCYNHSGVLRWPDWINTEDDNTLVPVAFRPEDIMIIVAGGEVGSYSSIVFCFGFESTTRRIPVQSNQGT